VIDEILNLVKKHEEWRGKQCLNLIPSENVMSPAVRKLLSSELAHRYTATDRFYMGTRFTDEIELYGEKVAREVFNAETADLRPLSGHIADLIILANMTKLGDTIICVSPEDGGYPGMWQDGLAGLLKLKTTSFPFSKIEMKIKTEEAKEKMRLARPKAIVFGASFIIFPYPVKDIAKVAAEEEDAFVGYDGSHVLGLIAGGEFQDPLREGAHALFGSTHKTFFGPQGGIILADKEHGELIKSRVYPAFVDNAHWNRIAALTLALAEMKEFGKAYARQVVRNSKALATALNDDGFPVAGRNSDFTMSHQVILNYENSKGRSVAEKLQQANIITDCAIRVGTCEVTRRGMKETEMLKIAELLKRAVVDEEKPETVTKDVAKLAADFQKIEYCFS
jgi:glycine hydroxymethyltransferase